MYICIYIYVYKYTHTATLSLVGVGCCPRIWPTPTRAMPALICKQAARIGHWKEHVTAGVTTAARHKLVPWVAVILLRQSYVDVPPNSYEKVFKPDLERV